MLFIGMVMHNALIGLLGLILITILMTHFTPDGCAMINLHNKIMNLSVNKKRVPIDREFAISYKNGHRDARHAAAELAINSDSEIERRVEVITAIKTAIVECFGKSPISDGAVIIVSKDKYNALVDAVNQATMPTI